MMSFNDAIYQETKLIKQGKHILAPFSKELADYVSDYYNVTVLNILYDFIDCPEKTPRIGIIVEKPEEYYNFTELPHGVGGYRKDCQTIVQEKFFSLLKKYNSTQGFSIDDLFKKMNLTWEKVESKDTFVYFDYFLRTAKEEAAQNITREKRLQFITKYKTNPIWDIHIHTSSLIIFFYTEKQKDENMENTIFKEMCQEYYMLVKPFDEFGYFNADSITVHFDSKENIDENYMGSFQYYYM
jgi:hypothetical protein